MLADPRYTQGVALTKQGKYDEALEFLGACVALVASEDDLSLAAAPVYFAYGDALLCKAEDSFDLFGAAMKEAKEKGGDNDEDGEEDEDEEVEGEEEEEEEEEAGNGKEPAVGSSSAAASSSSSAAAPAEGEKGEEGANKVAIPEEMQDDLEVAWENLEASRVIYHKYEDCVDAKKIGEVYLRLGDLQKSNGNYTQAVEDYLQSLAIYGKVCGQDSRILADLHYSLATAYIYASGVEEGQAQALKTKGLEHYVQCAQVFELLVAKAQQEVATSNGKAPAPAGGSKTTPEEDVKEFSEIVDELKETIEATKQELRAMGPGSAAAAAGPVTTVGFGAPSSSMAAAAAAAGAGVEESKVENGENQAASVNVMAVKKKAKPAAVAAAAAPAEEAGGEEGTKKRVVEQTEGPAEPPAAKEARAE